MNCFSTGWSVDKDGPGQRYVVYLKGCNMCCRWCANPESISSQKQVLYYPERKSSSVDYVCPYKAVNGNQIDRAKCHTCTSFECVSKWRNKCFEISGFELSPQDLAEKVINEKLLFGSDGGVTFGGGEPTLQVDEILVVLKLLKPEGIHTAVETNASTSGFKNLIGEIDLMICDLKCISPEKHQKWTGIDNKEVLKNLKFAAENQKHLLIRVPLVEGLNTDDKEIKKICNFLTEIKNLRNSLNVEVLRMHHMGQPKYVALGMDYSVKDIAEPDIAIANKLNQKLNILSIVA